MYLKKNVVSFYIIEQSPSMFFYLLHFTFIHHNTFYILSGTDVRL